jgi:hypothetical protein
MILLFSRQILWYKSNIIDAHDVVFAAVPHHSSHPRRDLVASGFPKSWAVAVRDEPAVKNRIMSAQMRERDNIVLNDVDPPK